MLKYLAKRKKMQDPQKNRVFTYQERKLIQTHISKGLSCAKIADLIGRSKTGVVVEVRRGGGRLYNAKESQKLADERASERYRKLSIQNRGKQFGLNYSKRIENLEMQIEILHDCIKELMGK